MKKILLTFLLAVMAIAIHAATFDNGDFTYTIISDNTCNLVGYSSSANTSRTSITIPGYVWNASQGKRYQVTAIVSQAFASNQNLQNVTINYGVKSIGNSAFYNCQNLTWVHLPSSVTSIGSYSFYMTRLQNVYCGCETMPSINSTAFVGLQSTGTRYWFAPSRAGQTAANSNSIITADFTVNWDPGLACDIIANLSTSSTMCDGYFLVTEPTSDPNLLSVDGIGKCKMLYANPRSNNTTKTLKFGYNQQVEKDAISYYVTEIADYAFMNNSTLKVLDMSESNKCEKIGLYAFQNSGLTSVILSAQTIANYAFDGCTNLSSVRLYGSSESGTQCVQSLGFASFRGTAVTSVYIPQGLTSYESGAFSNCPNLTQFTVSSSNTAFAAYDYSLYSKDYTTLYQYPSGRNAFYFDQQSHLSLTKISGYAFKGNTMTSRLQIPYGVKNIGAEAFSGMSSLETLLIPSSVTTFVWNTFQYMTGLKNFYFNIKTIPSSLTSSNSFLNIKSGCVLHVPRQCKSRYSSTSPWSTAFTGGIYEDSYDYSITYNNGSALNYYLGFTVTSTASYTDTKVQSAAANGQMSITYGYVATEGGFTGNLNLPNTVSLRGKTYIVSEVDREVFRDQTLIQRVTGGDGIKKIGALSFAGLTGCTVGFYLHNPVEFCDSALYNCKTPIIELGDRLERIGKDAFRYTNVRQVLMPPSVTSIGSRFLAGATNLDTLRLSPNITDIPMHGLGWINARYIVIPYGVKTIGKAAFFSDKAQIGSSEYLYEIGCENVVVIPSSVTYIDPDAFTYARHLDDIYLNCPYGVFTTTSKYNWQRRTDYNGDNVYNWSGHKMYVPVGQVQQYRNDPGIAAAWNENSDIGPGAFDFTNENNFVGTNYRMTVVNPTTKTAKYVYGEGNTSNAIVLSNGGTDHNTGITYTMVEIGDSAFVKHTAATHIYLDDATSLTRIGAYAFRGLTALNQEVKVPTTVTEIGKYAFYGCTNLPSVFLNRSSGTTSIGTYMFSSSQQSILYVPLNRFYNIANQTSGWLANTASNRRLLPYVKPTTEWSAISVPVSDNILLPATGQFYYASSLNTSNYSLGKTQLSNSQGIKGGEGMLMKGTVGAIYRFRRNDAVSSYTYVSPTTNYLKGVTGAYSTTLTYSSSGPYYYTFDGQKFNRVNSSATVYSGEAYAQTTSSYSNLYIDSGITTYNLWINGTQVTSENCNNLKIISGVSGTTVSYNPTTNTLTLNAATITTANAGGIRNEISGLTINVTGTNTVMVTEGNNYGLQVNQNTTITGTGTLNVGSALGTGCFVYTGKTLTVNGGVQVKFAGTLYGILGYSTTSRLIISGASTKLTAKGTSQGSYYQLPTTMNDGLAITSPAGAYFNSNGTVMYNGSVAKNIEVIISKPTVTRGDVNGDSTVNISDVTALINYLLSHNASGINLDAANCNQDSTVNISDVTALINYLLSHNW